MVSDFLMRWCSPSPSLQRMGEVEGEAVVEWPR